MIAHKLSAGNRTDEGAEAHSVVASVLRTCRLQEKGIVGALTELLRNGPGHIHDLFIRLAGILSTIRKRAKP